MSLAYCRPALAAAQAANPPLATLAQALRAPLLPVVGYAELMADARTLPEAQRWAAEILLASRELRGVLDCTLALAGGRAVPHNAAPQAQSAAEDAVAALRRLLAPTVDCATDDCGEGQRLVA